MLKRLLSPMLIACHRTTIKRTKPKPKTKTEQKAPSKKRSSQRTSNRATRLQEPTDYYSTEYLSDETITVNGVSFVMKGVQGGVFTMGATPEQSRNAYNSEKPKHRVAISSFRMGQTEVTQRLWQAVMGNNPSCFKGDNRPVEYVSWNDCQAFIRKLNQLTGRNFRLPTEAEWEYAARGGNRSKGYKYAGSNNIDNVAWYRDNSGDTTYNVGLKQPNELGLYDMTGNVWEWCSDRHGRYSSSAQTNPRGASWWGFGRVLRGGNCYDDSGLRNSRNLSARNCRVSCRGHSIPGFRYTNVGLRLVLSEQQRREEQQAENAEKERRRQEEAEQQRIINNLISNMVYVQGGTFTMGATPEQGSDAYQDEKPKHKVTLSSYYIGKYEVTQREWQAVMGSNPSGFKGDNRPVEEVSWNDCQAFIRKLNQLTGRNFRLPTEAEWEYAARGGNRSKGYKYAGSDNIDNVAWYYGNSGNTTHDVGLKQPNELGLYDMSGNVYEWCSDGYGRYSSSAQTNPRGASSGSSRVYRGGNWYSGSWYCRVSYRDSDKPDYRNFRLGLRLVLSEQQRREEQQAENAEKERRRQEEAEQQRIINNLISNMVEVEGGTFTMGATPEQGSDAAQYEKPTHQVTLSSYYIGKYEVTQREWQAVMGSNPSRFEGDNRPVEQVSRYDCQAFIRKLNQLTGRNFRLPTEAEWEYAARGGNRSKGYKYAGSNHIDNVTWYYGNSGNTTHDVGLKQPNELGLYDMSGNVYEWCSDGYGPYSSSAQTNPRGASSGSDRVYRGGSWYSGAGCCRLSLRGYITPGYRDGGLGLRLVL